jgi:UV DNA damage repair endonuclease
LDFTRDWYSEIWEEIETILAQAGETAQRHAIRLSVHPGQYTVLGSNKSDVVEKSIEDLEYHALYGSLMGLPAQDFTMNIHLQGLYGGKHEDGIKRFATNFHYLSDYAKGCLAVENEDKPNGYDIAHTLELAQRIPIRCTLDTHHYACHRMVETERVKVGEKTVNRKVRDVDHITHTSDYFVEAVKSWRGVRPLFHKSQSFHPDNSDYWMKPNAHSETYWDEYLMANHVPMLEYADFDIEAKFKEVAVQRFYDFIKSEQDYSGEEIQFKRAA